MFCLNPAIIAVFVLIFTSSCGNENKNACQDYKELADSIKKEQEKLDSIVHLHVQDSLRNTEGNRIIGNIHFGMSKRNYENACSKLLNECGGYLTIEDCKFEFSKGYFDLGQLYGVKLLSHCEKTNWRSICDLFTKKYGPPTYPGASNGSFPMSERYHKYWLFDFKRIDVRFDSNAHGNDFYEHGTVYIEIRDPHILDRIQKRNKKQEEENAQKVESNRKIGEQYASQL